SKSFCPELSDRSMNSSSLAMDFRLGLAIQNVVSTQYMGDPVAQKRHAEADQEDGSSRGDQAPRGTNGMGLSLGQHGSPVGLRRLDAYAEVGQRAEQDQQQAKTQSSLGQHRAGHKRQDMVAQDEPARSPDVLGRFHVVSGE